MKKSKLVLVLAVATSLLFVIFLVKTAIELGRVDLTLASSPNVQIVTDQIVTKLLITKESLSPNWVEEKFDDTKWKTVHIPKDWLLSEPGYKDGSYAYYRIRLPKKAITKLRHLNHESVINLYYVNFSEVQYYSNGSYVGTNRPINYNESILDIPIVEKEDNLVAIKGLIKSGDLGITHRGEIFAGKKAELNELHRKSYKGIEVFSLMFLMSKGSIFLIFTLIFLVVKTEKYFEYSLLFSLFVFLEDIVIGDYVSKYLNFNRQVFLYDVANIGYMTCFSLFLNSVLGQQVGKKKAILLLGTVIIISTLISVDLLYFSKLFAVDGFMKFWNCLLMTIILYFVPRLWRSHRVLSSSLAFAFLLIGWSTFFASSMANNFKTFANLLIFIVVAYQTFLLFRRQQNQLVEQEKDVAIGRTAAVLAHDVRRPLDQMSLLLSRISEGDTNQEFIKVAQKDIQFSLNAVNNQISDIMNYGRTTKVILKPTSLYDVLSGSLKQVMSITDNVTIELYYNFKHDNKIMGEESRLSSAIANVLANSVEAIRDIGGMSSGSITIETNVSDGRLSLSILNNGPNIPAEVLPNIFKPLYTNGKVNGTGLGLASVLKLIKDHDGTIEISNKQDGVQYLMQFDTSMEKDIYVPTNFKNISTEYLYPINPKVCPRTVRVFLLDDDKYVYEYLNDLSEKSDFEVELYYFTSVADAEEGIKKRRYDVYIIDFDLGGLKNGVEFIEDELLKLKSVVVLHTGRSDLENVGSSICLHKKPITLYEYNLLLKKADENRLRVLLIEDSKLIGISWKMFHGSANIVVCSNPEEGLEYFRENHEALDLCLVDYYYDNSPIRGIAIIEEMNRLDSGVKTIMVTNTAVESSGIQTIGKNEYEIRTLL